MAFEFQIQPGATKIAKAEFHGKTPKGDPVWAATPADALTSLKGNGLECEITAGLVPKQFSLTATIPGDPDGIPTSIASIRGEIVGTVGHGTISVTDTSTKTA